MGWMDGGRPRLKSLFSDHVHQESQKKKKSLKVPQRCRSKDDPKQKQKMEKEIILCPEDSLGDDSPWRTSSSVARDWSARRPLGRCLFPEHDHTTDHPPHPQSVL
ncbi:hypothetical protein FS842_005922 [Serendipita sp. 407]|nr:hypothetical protein FS842_005922 [Serendipita sp. 407]